MRRRAGGQVVSVDYAALDGGFLYGNTMACALVGTAEVAKP